MNECRCSELESSVKELETRLDHYNKDKDERISAVHEDMLLLRRDVQTLSSDVRDLTTSVRGIESSLRQIAVGFAKLTGLPETWQSVRGFWRVMQWLKDNAVVIAFVVVLVTLAIQRGFGG